MTKSDMRIEVTALLELVRMLEDRLSILHHELHNRPARTKSPSRRNPITEEVRAKVWALHVQRPDLSQHEIARVLGISNSGRVSEIIAGKRV